MRNSFFLPVTSLDQNVHVHAVLVAEVLYHYFPKEVQLHNYRYVSLATRAPISALRGACAVSQCRYAASLHRHIDCPRVVL
jgi:hypothetical protein